VKCVYCIFSPAIVQIIFDVGDWLLQERYNLQAVRKFQIPSCVYGAGVYANGDNFNFKGKQSGNNSVLLDLWGISENLKEYRWITLSKERGNQTTNNVNRDMHLIVTMQSVSRVLKSISFRLNVREFSE
jgi:hypothetical protein